MVRWVMSRPEEPPGAYDRPGMPDTVPRVLVVEDDTALREALQTVLTGEGYQVTGVRDGQRLADQLATLIPDLAILDVRLPEGPDGFALAGHIRTRSDLPILFLTAADSERDRLAGFDAGGDDYLTKPFSMPELLARVRVLLRRSGRLVSPVRRVGSLVVDDSGRTVVYEGQAVELTRTEFDLLAVLARRPGHVFGKSRLLAMVWDYESYDANVVEVHVSAIRRKLEAHGPRILHTVRGVGYVLRA